MWSGLMERLFHAVIGLEGPKAAVILALFPLLEASLLIGVVVPGETALVLGGALVYMGRVSFVTMAVAGALGAIIGDSIGYWIGRRWGNRWVMSRIGRKVGGRRWERAQLYMRRRGPAAVAFGRFPPVVRSLMPMLAGSARMPFGRFLAADTAGGVTWAVGSVALGWLAGAAWERVHRVALLVMLAISGLLGLVLWLRARRAGRHGSSKSRPSRAW
ncbi:MAG: DedA family protein [Deltaproteobacteria bacterium]|nr:DedA family protein [Deltaproteobacteria bacterium]